MQAVIDTGDIVLDYGGSTTIMCKITSYPPPNITWTTTANTDELVDVITNNGIEYTSSIILNYVDENYEGEYICTAENDFYLMDVSVMLSLRCK